MFTGIVQGAARLVSVEPRGGARSIVAAFPPGALRGLKTGASVALDGVCLTAVWFEGDRARFDVIGETLRLTTPGRRAAGDRVNFERAAAFGDEIGGHLLSGHVVGTAEIVAREDRDDQRSLTIQLPELAAPYVLPKGFVALDGISLTVGTSVEDGRFQVHLIPETLQVTTLGVKGVGDRVNLEVDAMTRAVVDTVERVLARR